MTEDVRPQPVMEFEGAFIRQMEGKLPMLTLDMPEGYQRGTHLKMHVEVRVRNVLFSENKDGDLVRQHVFAIEDVQLAEAFDPATRPESSSVGGNAAGDETWAGRLTAYLEGETDELDFEGEEIPERLREILEAFQTEQVRQALASVPVEHHGRSDGGDLGPQNLSPAEADRLAEEALGAPVDDLDLTFSSSRASEVGF